MQESELAAGLPALVLQYINAGIVVYAADGSILHANAIAASMLGFAPGRANGPPERSDDPTVVREDGSPMPWPSLLVRDVLASGEPVRNVVAGIERTGIPGRTWVTASAFPLEAGDGLPARVVVVLADVTERKLAEEALKASRAKLDAALASMTDAVFISDTNGAFVDFNDAFAAFHRFASKAECRRTLAEYPDLFDVFAADGTPAPLEQWAVPRALRGETVTDAEYGLRRKDTGESWFGSYSFGPIRDANGAIVGSVAVARDITRRKTAERALCESEQRFERSFHGSPAGQSLTTVPDGMIVEVNDAYLNVFGYEREELVGRTTLEAGLYARIEDREKLLEAWQEIGERGPHEVQIRTRSGETRTVLASFQRVELGGMPCVISSIDDITERKRAEEALARSEERFRRTFHASPAGQLITTRDGRILEVNDAYLRMLGYTREECIGHTTLEIGLYADPGERARIVERLQAGEPVHDVTIELRTSSGDVRTMIASLELIELGGVECLSSSVMDVTDRMRAEQRQGESDRRYRLLFENTGMLAVYLAPDGRIELMNRLAAEAWGGTPEQFQGRHVSEVYGAFADEIVKRVHRALESDELQSYESLVPLPGGPRWYASHYRRAVDDDGRPIGVQAVVLDVTERKQAEIATQESEERFRTLVATAPEGIFVQCDGVFRFVNPALARMLGAQGESDLLGTSLLDRTAPEFHAMVQERIRRQQETGHAVPPAEQDLLRMDGSRVAVETLAVPVRFEGRDGHLVFVRDVSARRADEKERESLRVQLQQAQKMESVGRLAGGVAHDFNNLLVVILNYADFALKALHAGDPLRRDILEIRDAGQRAAALTGQLLAFSRKQVLQPVPLGLNEVPLGLEKMLRRIIGEDITLELALAPDAGVVVADRNQLEQVLMNLVTNSRDAMPRGGRLTIASRNLELSPAQAEGSEVGPGEYVELAVTDTGSGMDAETRAHVFEPFFTTKPVGRGTGLGLATVYGIVRQSGGWVVAESEPGAGTTMRVRLPRDRAAHRSASPAATAERPRGTETVLVVEDEAALRQIVCRLLESSGYTVRAAAGRDEALAIAAMHKERVDLLLTDVVMPKAAGPEVARALAPHWPQLRVLYMSGYAGEQMEKYGIDELAGRLLLKPFTGPALLRKVREALDAPEPSPRP